MAQQEVKTQFYGDTAGDYVLVTHLGQNTVLITKKINGKLTNEEITIGTGDEENISDIIKKHTDGIQLPLGTASEKYLPRATSRRNDDDSKDVDLPKFDDELELQKRPAGPPPPLFPRDRNTIPSIGSSDLQPTETYPSTRPYLDPLRRDPQSGGDFNGMIVDKNHPIFGQNRGQEGETNPPDHPPGARYDDPLLRDEAIGLGLPQGSIRRFGSSNDNNNNNNNRFGPPGSGSSGFGGNPFGGFI
jgi:hypothetical protein